MASSSTKPRFCAYHPELGHDAVRLEEPLGWCSFGLGYPSHWTRPPERVFGDMERGRFPLRCPVVCPRCRHPLSWNGACDHCRGSDTPNDPRTWYFTGDYDDAEWTEKAGPAYGHYQKIYGPRPFSTETEVMDSVQEFHRVVRELSVRLSVSETHRQNPPSPLIKADDTVPF
jgi:hypothetical protein